MSKRILLILSHSIEEHDQLKLLSGLGYEVFSLGGYINPSAPHDPKRPPLPDVTHFADLQAVVDGQGVPDNIGAAAQHIPDEILEWLGDDGIVIAHHYLERIFGQWEHLRDWRKRGGRIIWRTVGQSTADNELRAQQYRADGLEIVRYSPNEIHIPNFSGEDALIRFYKDPDEWMGWHGTGEYVTNVTQDLARRDPWTNAEFFFESTAGLDVRIAGDGSDQIPVFADGVSRFKGFGVLPLKEMQELLQDARCYLYCGTQPASYTLGLIEALMTGVPVVSIHHGYMTIFPYGPQLFEGDTLAPLNAASPEEAHDLLDVFLRDHDVAKHLSEHQRHRAIQEFGIENVGAAWKNILG